MSTVVNTKKSGNIQSIIAVAIVGFGIMVSSFGFAQASEKAPVTTPVSVTTTVHVSSTGTVGGALGR